MERKQNETHPGVGGLEAAAKGLPVSRRWLLRNSANAAAGAIAVSALGAGAGKAEAPAVAAGARAMSVGAVGEEIQSDRPQGYVHSLHGWDTI
jgi:hypothetical protein